jgi:hypothetical protein
VLVTQHLRKGPPRVAEPNETEAKPSLLHAVRRRLDEKAKLLDAALNFPVGVVVHEAQS